AGTVTICGTAATPGSAEASAMSDGALFGGSTENVSFAVPPLRIERSFGSTTGAEPETAMRTRAETGFMPGRCIVAVTVPPSDAVTGISAVIRFGDAVTVAGTLTPPVAETFTVGGALSGSRHASVSFLGLPS